LLTRSRPDLSQSISTFNKLNFFRLRFKLYLQIHQLIASSKRFDLFGENCGLNEFDGVTHLLTIPDNI
jgi:hypothetical protein